MPVAIGRGPRHLRYQRRHLLKTYAFTELGGIIRTSTPSTLFRGRAAVVGAAGPLRDQHLLVRRGDLHLAPP